MCVEEGWELGLLLKRLASGACPGASPGAVDAGSIMVDGDTPLRPGMSS
jgi:hypothetical protein